MTAEKTIKNTWILSIIMCAFVFLTFTQSCNSSRKTGRVESDVKILTEKVDSLNSVIHRLSETTVQKSELREMLDANMLEFLIYEDDIDKGRITVGQLKLEIREKNRNN